MLAYRKDDEIWAICRVYDNEANKLMTGKQLSTSTAVVFKPADGNEKIELNGETFLLEGNPSLLDHVCICEAGVWDKGGPPTGIQNDTLPSTITEDPPAMTDEEKAAAEKARNDSTAKLDAIMDALGKVSGRMDAMEARDTARKDAEESEKKERAERERADRARHDAARKDRFGARKDGESHKDWKARHDADEAAMCDALEKSGVEKDKARKDAADCRRDAEEGEKEEGGESFKKWAEEEGKEAEHNDKARKDAEEAAAREKEEKDRARHDSATIADLKATVAGMQSLLTQVTATSTVEDRNALAQAQARADSIAGLFGNRALPPIPGESPLAYRRRLANDFKQHSAKFKDKALGTMDADVLGVVEEQIYHDAETAARAPNRAGPGRLIPIREVDEAGRTITRYTGDNMAWMSMFMSPGRVGRIIDPRNRAH